MKQVQRKDRKQAGFIVMAELILIATILVIGLIVGMVTIRDAMTSEMEDVAEAFGAVDQSYQFEGMTNAENTATVGGSNFIDNRDVLSGDGNGYTFNGLPNGEQDGEGYGNGSANGGSILPGTLD